MFKKPWFLAAISLSAIAAIIGAVVYAGLVLQPQWAKEDLARKNKEACEVFQTALQNASAETELAQAFDKLFRGANKALEVFDPSGTSKVDSWGPEYDEFMKLGQMEYAVEQMGDVAYETIANQVLVIQAGCAKVLEVKISTPAPTPTN
ncbi:MAG: hypothetical protein RIT51_349 [Actinomycetota bacterium]|jgi:hypothetical protein